VAAVAAGAYTVFPWDRYLIGFYSSFSTLFFFAIVVLFDFFFDLYKTASLLLQ